MMGDEDNVGKEVMNGGLIQWRWGIERGITRLLRGAFEEYQIWMYYPIRKAIEEKIKQSSHQMQEGTECEKIS
jgi:hypothetical protein